MLFVGRAEERKGLPVLLRAFEALAEHIPCRLTAIGVDPAELERHLPDPEIGELIDARGRISQAELWQAYRDADVLCAPSLAGESFGMVLTEAFAAGTPVIASAIAGYSDVVSDGRDGILVPPGDPQRLAEELLALHHEPHRLQAMSEYARESAARYAWPRVAARVETVYERALAAPQPHGSADRLARLTGMMPADGSEPVPAERLPSLDPPPDRGSRRRRVARRVGVLAASIVGAFLTYLAAQKIGFNNVVDSAVRSNWAWVLIAAGLMGLSLFFRSATWYLTARSALPRAILRRRDFTSATMIGVLMSATLPARLGEPARAMIMARRIGRVRESFPVLLGTLVSQTVLNIVALVGLGAIIVSSTDLFSRSSEHLFLVSMAPALLLVAVLIAPALVRRSGSGRIARIAALARESLLKVRSGLAVFRDPRRGPLAAVAQLTAWAIQVAACYALGTAMGLNPADGYRRRRRGALRRQRDRGRAGDPVEHRRLPARRRQRAHHRLRRRRRRRARLRRDPAGGRDRDRGRARPAGAGPRGHDLVGRAPANDERRAGPPAARRPPPSRGDRSATASPVEPRSHLEPLAMLD